MVVVYLDQFEEVYAESGALVVMSAGVKTDARMAGGVVRSAARKFLGQESFFVTRFRGDEPGSWVAFAPGFPGDIADVEVPSEGLIVQPGSYLAHSSGVQLSASPGSFSKLLGREGAFVVTLKGEGHAWITSYGALQRFDLSANQSLVVDSGHFVAATGQVGYKIGTLDGVVTSALSGEGLVATVSGPGSVWIQTRAPREFQSWLLPGYNSG